MAYVQKNNRYHDLKAGCYRGKIIKYEPKGKKVTKNGGVFNQGYLTILINEDITVRQYILVAPWRKFLFYKLVKAISDDFNVQDKYLIFNFDEVIGKEVVVEVEYEFNGYSSYPNILNFYNLKDGEKIMEFEKMQEELKEEQMEEDGLISMEIILKRAEKINPLIEEEFNDDDIIEF